MKKDVLIPALIAAFIILSGCGNRKSTEVTDTSPGNPDEVTLTSAQIRSAGIEFGAVTKQLLSHDVHAKGKLVVPPQNDAWIGSMTGGIIETILVSEGVAVIKGQVLATLVSPSIIALQQDYISLLSRKSQLEKEYERQKELGTDRIASEKRIQEAESDFKDISARLNAVSLQLNLLHIPQDDIVAGRMHRSVALLSPISGFVDKIKCGIGQYAEPQDQLFHVIDKRRLIIELSVFEKDIPVVKTGQRVTFEFGNLSTGEYEARVLNIGKSVEENARTVNVLADFVNTSSFMLPGMFVSAEIHTAEMEVDALPEEAVLTDEKPAYVYYTETPAEAQALVFKRMNIKTGYEEDGYVQVELENLLPPAGRIVTKGTYFIKSVAMRGKE